MTKREIEKWQSRAKACAIKHGYRDLAEDFASEIFLILLGNPSRRSTVDQMFIDFLRKHEADPRTLTGKAKLKAKKTEHSFDDKPKNGLGLKETLAAKEEPKPLPAFHYGFDWQEEIVYKLYFIQELTMREIGQVFGLTESAMSLRLKKIKEKIRKVLKSN